MKPGAIVIAAGALALAGCRHAGPAAIVAAPSIRAACGWVRPWEPGFQKRMAGELRKLPSGHVFRTLARDAISARDAVRICRQER